MMKLVNDPCGIFCILFTYTSIIYADYVVIQWVVLHTMQDSLWAPFHIVLFNTFLLLLTVSHLRAMFSDPGTVPLSHTNVSLSDLRQVNEPLVKREDWTMCTRCEAYRPPRAHHCRICKRCIRRMDHHCPWINNCVGEKNQKYFVQFLFFVCIISAYTIMLVIMSWVRECRQCKMYDMDTRQTQVLHSVILIMESALFGMFVIAILYDQMDAIYNDQTTIEQTVYKRPNPLHRYLFSVICRWPKISRSTSKLNIRSV
ncbi:palmitoyltransferase ZDHHC3 isoform X1 [Acyrthosiphon pisum]|uniref:Palmitoyltransferase n=1 Tax=Acyrthosiphon pisum TaxID=7029 RepID=A0A8R2AYN1_ACYPI|nr:palmitoyltransferase ZDHHC3 isoform X1 [Acyrthosiphon pisum]XP_060861334.1 palmitoyltransferase ZDHHC3 isoform X1 [Metopolophium dirhodum]|eukprot:XP_008178297.1 PREDICTED: palmitoyltransferase ZDHHC3 isoform X1 [Acyrthosiphon pisum]